MAKKVKMKKIKKKRRRAPPNYFYVIVVIKNYQLFIFLSINEQKCKDHNNI